MELKSFRQHIDHITNIDMDLGTFATKNLDCDSRYRSIVNQLGALIELAKQRPEHNLTKNIDQLLDSMINHICSENKVMKQLNYPQVTRHQAHHYSILGSASELLNFTSNNQNELPDKLVNIRQLWLDHIHLYDRTFEEFLTI